MTDLLSRLTTALADRYRIERELGSGGMATVYLAHDIKHERKVAIKVLREDLAASMGSARFLREIQIAAQLSHPNILPLLDSGDTDGFLYYVMPYVSGQSLRERLAREGELPVHEAVRLLCEVTDALAESHRHGVVHRDIKPDNVMLSGRHALVTDFGVAKAISEATGRNTVTTLGVAVGTPTYMSPEQAAADPHIDHRSDIYSVGVMAYEMLSGRAPFTGTTPQQVLAAHVTEAPDPVSKRRPAIPAALEQIVMRCLAKRPADRYQTAEELLQLLEAQATPSTGITPTQTRPVTAWTDPTTQRRWLTPFLALLGVVAVALVAWKVLRPEATAMAVVDVPRVQVTYSGTVERGALSPDGQRVAYSERECAEDSRCPITLVVQDIAGAGRLKAATGLAGVYEIQWSPDGRRLMFVATTSDGQFGFFSVPSLGGAAPQFVMAAPTFFFGNGDSLLIGIAPGPNQLAIFAMHGNERRGGTDTARISRPGLEFGDWMPSPDGKWLGFETRTTGSGRYLLLTDRRGTVLDSMRRERGVGLLGWSPNGQMVLEVRDTINSAVAAIVEQEITSSGKFGSGQRTLVTSQLMFDPNVSPGGVSYLAGAVEAALHEAERTTAAPGKWKIRRLTSTTAEMSMLMSGDGKFHIMRQTPRVDPSLALSQLTLLPFGGGASRELNMGIRGLLGLSRTVGADSVIAAHLEAGRTRFTAFDLATGRSRDAGTLDDTTALNAMEVMRDGSIVWYRDRDSVTVLHVREPSGTLRTISLPNVTAELLEDASWGHGLLGWGWTKPSYDSLVIFHVPPGESSARPLFRTVMETVIGMRWTREGMIEIVFGETTHNSALYQLNPRTGMLKRVASIPLNDVTSISFSIDGLHWNMRTEVAKRDLWIARVFD